MPKQEAVTLLAECCKLSPPADSDVEKQNATAGHLLGHMILPKTEPPDRILGTIFFESGKVAQINRGMTVS
jgi:hypothetical protein